MAKTMTATDEARLLRRRRHELVGDLCLAGALLGLGLVIGLAVDAESVRAIGAAGGFMTAVGRLCGLTGAYLMMLMVLLMARIPVLEQAVGHDRLTRWHRRLGGWPIALIGLHVIFITLGYAEAAKTGVLSELWTFITSYPDVLAAIVGFCLLIFVGVASWRAARSRMRYETWWATHLYVYIALALAFAHQIITGASFVAHPFTRIVWTLLWAGTAGTVLSFRVLLPLWRSCYHRLRIVSVKQESEDVISIICSGKHLDRLPAKGGQFFQWRFLRKGLWWQAHPYSMSARVIPPYVRVTVRVLGDHGATLASLTPGTRVAIEGPYGVFTADRRATNRVLLVGAGVGITPLRAILDDLPQHVDATVIFRASDNDDLVLHAELAALLEARAGRMHTLVGSRKKVRLDAHALRKMVPDIADRDVYVCGPEGFSDSLVGLARKLGVPDERIHREAFAF
ncbi:MAG TPA: ferredoxin reductase family protein [Acidimicrobiales bacterium]|nr:ferredoxin reductase family protein [Acidimicrobiales bacterium]